jgi:branched-chain amino acid aminotransferase
MPAGLMTETRSVHFRAVTIVYVDGELVPRAQANVSAFDHGLLTGDGVFETLLVRQGRPFAVRRHLDRLERSASGLELPLPARDELASAVAEIAGSMRHHARARLRITVTGGAGVLGSARAATRPTVIVAATPIEPAPPPHASVLIAPWPRNERSPLAGLKTISYAENVLALAWARERGASEALFGNTVGNLCEGTGSNVFLVLDGTLVTPPLTAGPLAGVTRDLVLELVECVEKDVPLEVLRAGQVEEMFLTATTRGVLPVTALEDQPVGTGDVGPLTAKAAAALAGLMEGDDEP